MAYTKSPRPYKKEYKKQVERKEHPNRMERQKARRALDKKGVKRKGKDVSHNVALSRGGSNKDGVTIENSSTNRARKPRKKTATANTGGKVTKSTVKKPSRRK